MKIIVFSDSHSSFENLKKAVNIYKPERIYGCGDYACDIYELDRLNIRGVRGNNYLDPELENDLYFNLMGFNIHLTHGHTYSVRMGIDRLYFDALKNKVDITFYGHTHVAKIERSENMYFINPGSITLPEYPSEPTFALLDVENNKMNVKIIGALSNDCYKEENIIKC